jgi:hypothetical protein
MEYKVLRFDTSGKFLLLWQKPAIFLFREHVKSISQFYKWFQ